MTKKNKIIFFIIFNLVLIILLYLIPIEDSNLSLCLYKAITGKKCYNCGMTRAFLNILHLNFHKAYEYNKNVIVVFPLTVIVYLYSWYKYINKEWRNKNE